MVRSKEHKLDSSLSICDIQPFGEYTKKHEEAGSLVTSGGQIWVKFKCRGGQKQVVSTQVVSTQVVSTQAQNLFLIYYLLINILFLCITTISLLLSILFCAHKLVKPGAFRIESDP